MLIHARNATVLFLVSCISLAAAQTIHVTGKVTDQASSAAVAGASVSLTNANISVVTDSQGRFTLDGSTGAIANFENTLPGQDPIVKGSFVQLAAFQSSQQVRIDVFDLAGRYVGTPVNQVLKAGVYQFAPLALLGDQLSHQPYLIRVKNGLRTTAHTIFSSITKLNESGMRLADQSREKSLEKRAAGEDVLKVRAQEYQAYSQDLPSYTDTGLTIQLSTATWICTTSDPQGMCGQSWTTHPFCTSKITGVQGGPAGGCPYVGQDEWSAVKGETQTLNANGVDDFEIIISAPSHSDGAVTTFPNASAPFDEQKMSSFSSIISTFDETMPHNSQTIGWAAFDNWFDNSRYEVMIQHDFSVPPGAYGCTYVAVADFIQPTTGTAQHWGLCLYGTELIWHLAPSTAKVGDQAMLSEPRGSIDVKAMTQFLVDHGYMDPDPTISGLSYGWEVVSTGGLLETFRVYDFTLHATP